MRAANQIKSLKRLEANKEGMDFFVGDLHGCRDLFERLMEKRGVDPDKGDRVFCVGDLIDRGPDSLGCVSLLKEPWFHCVIGNHDLFMLEALHDGDPIQLRNWLHNGGSWHLECTDEQLNDALTLMVNHLSVGIEVPCNIQGVMQRIGVVHSDVTTERWGHFVLHEDVWDRHRVTLDIQRSIDGIDHVLAGHTIHKQPRRYGNLVVIDTGGFHPEGCMTMVRADEVPLL